MMMGERVGNDKYMFHSGSIFQPAMLADPIESPLLKWG